ncbi:uncharacterized protein LOC136091673 [Hydra vulgaris]|uniref:Uncharacterized protein LOC136091673 n=1 Tax=Hydra vulgaris TaxID=6087 RepID=A0ABM4DLM6_HYDVU
MCLAADCSDIIKAIQTNEKIITDKFEVVKKKTKELSIKMKDNSDILKIKSKLREMEDRSQRNNLRIEGIKENENENWRVSESKVQKLFEDILGLKDIKIERAHRTGLRSTHKIRPIVVKLLNYKDKVVILKQAKNLKGKNIFINKDYCAETTIIRKQLREQLKIEREGGNYAVILYDKLIIRNWTPKENFYCLNSYFKMETNLLPNFNSKNNTSNDNDINKIKAFLINKNILLENNLESNISFYKDGEGMENIITVQTFQH